MVFREFKERYGQAHGSGATASGTSAHADDSLVARQRFQAVQELLAFVYAAIRDNEPAVRAVDQMLKEKYGVGRG